MRKSLLVAALLSASALSTTAFAEKPKWLSGILPSKADETPAVAQVQPRVQAQVPQAPHDAIMAQQEIMKRQEEAFEMQRSLQSQAMQRQLEEFQAQQQSEREEFDASQQAQREEFESEQLAQAEAFKTQQMEQERDMERQLEAFQAMQQAAADYTQRMEPGKDTPDEKAAKK